MKIRQRHCEASKEFIEGLVLGSLGLARDDVYSTYWDVVGLPALRLIVTIQVGSKFTLDDVNRVQHLLESFAIPVRVEFGGGVHFYFKMENMELGHETIKLLCDKVEKDDD